jgi:tetratricopeptide (TPR) repeat protein
MRIARLSNRWFPIFLIALCVFVIYSNIYSSPFVFDDKIHIVEKENIGDLDYHMSFDRLRQPRGIVYLTFALNYRFGGLNVFGYHLVNVLIHMTNGILAYFLSLTICRQLAPSLAQPSEDQAKPTPKTKRKKPKGSQIRSVKGGKHKSRNAAPSSRSAHTVASQSSIINYQSLAQTWHNRAQQGETRNEGASEPSAYSNHVAPGRASIHWMALFAALIFVAHPIQTQAVTYTVQRLAATAAMFFLASVLFYVRARVLQQGEKVGGRRSEVGGQGEEDRGRRSEGREAFSFKLSAYFALSILCGMLAFLSKQNTACLPLMILLVEYMLFERTWQGWRRKLTWLVPVFLLFGLFVLHTFGLLRGELDVAKWLEDVSEHMTQTEIVGRWEYLCTQFNVMVVYVRLLFFPIGQNLDPMYPFKSGFFDGLTPLAFLFLIGLVALGIWNIKKRPIISLGIFWFFIALSVESSIIPIHDAMFEHRLYLPMFGFALVVTYLIFEFFLSRRRSWAILGSVVIILSLCTATYLRNRVWQSSITLWSDVTDKNPQNARGHINLGNALDRKNRHEKAIDAYSKALQMKTEDLDAHYNLAVALERRGKFKEAGAHYLEALRLQPNDVQAHYARAVVLVLQGKIREAITHYGEAVRRHPIEVLAEREGRRFEGAMANYCKKMQFFVRPDDMEGNHNLAMALECQGKLEEAASHYAKVLRIKPDYAEAHNNLGVVLARLARIQEAADHFSEAVRIKPGYADAKKNLQRARNLLSEPEG